jgi:hypothetical protein
MIQHQKYRHLVAVKTLKDTYPSQLQISFPPTLNYYSSKRLVTIISNQRIPSSDRIRKPMKFKVKHCQCTKNLLNTGHSTDCIMTMKYALKKN